MIQESKILCWEKGNHLTSFREGLDWGKWSRSHLSMSFSFQIGSRKNKIRKGLLWWRYWLRERIYPWWLSWWRIHLQCGRPGFDPWVGKLSWRREQLPTPVFWPGEFHELHSPWGRKELDVTERLSLSLILEKGQKVKVESRVCPILPLTCLFILDQVHTLIVWIIMPILLVTIFLSFWLLFALFSILDCYPFLESLLTKQLFVPDYLSQCFSLCYMSTVDCFSVAYNYGTTYTSLDWRHGRRGTGIELGSMQLKVYQQCIFVNYLKASTVPYDANFKISYAICCEFGGTNETQQVYPLKIGLCKIYHAGQTVKMRGFQKW